MPRALRALRLAVVGHSRVTRPAYRVPIPPAPSSLWTGDFDYTFTDKELEDVLGFMERQQVRGPGEPFPAPPQALPFLAPGTSQPPLQFQVRPGGGHACAHSMHGAPVGMRALLDPGCDWLERHHSRVQGQYGLYCLPRGLGRKMDSAHHSSWTEHVPLFEHTPLPLLI